MRTSCVLVLLGAVPALAQAPIHATPANVHWGYYAADAKPVLTVRSGEIVRMDTVSGIPEMLARRGGRRQPA